MPHLMTVRNGDEGTAKPTIRLRDEWGTAIHFSNDDERLISWVSESIDERVVLDFYVTDRDAALAAFQTMMDSLQELQIEEG